MKLRAGFFRAAFLSLTLFLNQQAAFAHHYTVDGQIDNGELKVYIQTDLKGTKSKVNYKVKKGRKTYNLKFIGQPPKGLYSGQRVSFKGKRISSNTIRVGTHESDQLKVVSSSAIQPATGVKQILVLRIKSSSAISSATESQIASVASQQKLIYEETSYQLFSMKNDRNADGVPDVYTVSISQSTAGLGESSAFSICDAAKTNVNQQFGITQSSWDHVVCILPPDMNYPWYGQAYVPGRDVVINGNYAAGYAFGLAHELGHNLGMHHANTPGVEYGDNTCIMGGNAGTAPRHFNAPHKVQMGWSGTSAAAAGFYQINAVEVQPSSRVSPDTILKIRDPIANVDLYISYRAPIGAYSSGPIGAYRTAIHSYNGGSVQTQLLATLGDGETYSQNGIVVTQLAHTDNSASVQIGAECVVANPLVSISPAKQSFANPLTANYTISITNKDSNCSASSFALSSILPGVDWSASFLASSITLSPGQTASTTFSLLPPSSLSSGTYNFSVSVAALAHNPVSVSGSYLLDNTAPAAITNLSAAISQKTKVKLSWSVPSGSTSSEIANYDIFRNNILIATSAATTFTDAPGTGSFSYRVAARDLAGNLGALSNTAQINVGQSKGGGGRK